MICFYSWRFEEIFFLVVIIVASAFAVAAEAKCCLDLFLHRGIY